MTTVADDARDMLTTPDRWTFIMSHTKILEKNETTTEFVSAVPAMTLSQGNSEDDCPSPKKKKHDTVTEARRHILKLSNRGRKPFGSYYWCKACEAYHVTSAPADKKNKFRRL